MSYCLNCGNEIKDKFCHACGQKDISNTDRSISHLLTDLASSAFVFDNRFWISVKYLFLKPGLMTREYISGKRRKFVSPVALFLFINIIYFFLSPLTDYSLPLYDQINYQPYSEHAKQLVDELLKERSITFDEYARTYKRTSDNVSQSIMILNIPMIAVFVFLISLRRTRFYFDSLIFTFHYFTLFLLSICLGDILSSIVSDLLKSLGVGEYFWTIWLVIFVMLIPISYAVISIRNYLSFNWFFAVLSGFLIFLGGGIAQLIYRGIIFYSTYYFA